MKKSLKQIITCLIIFCISSPNTFQGPSGSGTSLVQTIQMSGVGLRGQVLPRLAGRDEALHRQQARDTGEVRQGVPGSHRWWAWARGQTLDGTFIFLDTL